MSLFDQPIRTVLVAPSVAEAADMRSALESCGLAFSCFLIATKSSCPKALNDDDWDLICYSLSALPPNETPQLLQSLADPPLTLAFTEELSTDIVLRAFQMKATLWLKSFAPEQLARLIATVPKRRTKHGGACRSTTDVTAQHLRMAALSGQESELRSLYAHTPLGLCQIDRDGRIVKSNAALQRMLGYDEEELVGAAPEDLVHAQDLALTKEMLRSLFEGNDDFFQGEIRFLHRSGTIGWAHFITAKVSADAGPPKSALTFLEDITEMRRLEESFRSSERINSLVINSIVETVYLIGLSAQNDYLILSVNDAYLKMSGYRRDDVVGRLVKDIVEEPALSQLLSQFAMAIAERRTVRWDTFTDYPNGRVYAEVTATPLFDDDDRCTGLVGSIYDMTARVQAERKIAQQAALLDRAHDAIILGDIDGKIFYWNQGAARLYGWTSTKALTHNITDLILPRDFDGLTKMLNQLREEGSWTGERLHRTKSGKELIVDCSMTLTRDERGNPEYVLAINTDVTERKRLEARAMLAQRVESLSMMARGIAHDFNNILTTIIGNTALARRFLTANHPAQAKLSVIHDASARAVDLARQILAFSREGVPKPSIIALRPVVEQALRLLRATLPDTIRVEAHYSEDALDVLAAPTQIHQIVVDLAMNAASFIGNRPGTISISLDLVTLHEGLRGTRGEAPPGRYMRLTERDNGEGMDEIALADFLDSSYTPITRSPKFGISVVLDIIQKHNAALTVTSAPGKGTSFCIYFPIAGDLELPQRGDAKRTASETTQ